MSTRTKDALRKSSIKQQEKERKPPSQREKNKSEPEEKKTTVLPKKRPIIPTETSSRNAKKAPSRLNSTRESNTSREAQRTVTTKSTTSKRPITTKERSNRVVRTQYFPPKDMISKVVKAEKLKKVEATDDDDSSSVSSERPRTATLRKGSIVNMNIAGPEVPKVKTQKKPVEEEADYEDDFESYESDFEEYNSSSSSISEDLTDTNNESTTKNLQYQTEEDKKMDSGNFELSGYKHKHILDNIRESIEQENNNLSSESRGSNMTSLSDEGFVDTGSVQGVPFFNFVDAQKKFRNRKSAERRRRRGVEILSLIKLDTQVFTLFEFEPVPYSIFIKMYGRSDAIQVGTQTGDDNVSEGSQTDSIEAISKWTQFPVRFSNTSVENPDFYSIYKQEILGVGEESYQTNSEMNKPNFQDLLHRFLAKSSKVILTILEERNQYSLGNINGLSNVPFSNGFVAFNTTKTILDGRKITFVQFGMTTDRFLTIHVNPSEDFVDRSGIFLRSVVSIWSIYNPDDPERIITAYGDIRSCTFNQSEDFICGGLEDGTVVVWNLQELSQKSLEFIEDQTYNLPLPSFVTDINKAHSCPVVSIKALMDSSEDLLDNSRNGSEQICSLDEEGTLIFWAILPKINSKQSVVLAKNSTVSLRSIHPDLQGLSCTDLMVNERNSSHLFVSTNYGYIIHCLASNSKPIPPRYIPNSYSKANSVTACPFSGQYFLVAHDDGNINLYSTSIEKCLKTLNNKAEEDENCRIDLVEWSYTKPFIFYSKDNNNNIHIWDLEASDIFPVYSIPFRENISFMKLAPIRMENDRRSKRSYMVIVTDNGLIHLHLLNNEHGPQPVDKYEDDLKMFYKYVNRL